MALLIDFLTSNFDNRELATAFWFILIVALSLTVTAVRAAIQDVLLSLMNRKLIILFVSFSLWVWMLASVFEQIGLWKRDQLFATIFWIFGSGFVLLSRAFSVSENDRFFRDLVLDNLKVLGVFEFVIVAHSFAFVVEIVLLPVLTVVVLMLEISRGKKEFSKVQTFFEVVLLSFGLILLFASLSTIRQSPSEFFSFETGRNFILPIIFSVGSVPMIYFWFCYSHIENASLIIDLKTFQSDELKSYAKFRFFLIFWARPWLLNKAVRQFHRLPARSRPDVEWIIQEVYQHERDTENPPVVSENYGWSPFAVKEFLGSFGLHTNEFHRFGDELEWFADANSIELDTQIFPSTATLYLNGSKGMVTKIKLVGAFENEFPQEEGFSRLKEIEIVLIANALSIAQVQAEELLRQASDSSIVFKTTKISRRIDEYVNNRGFNVILTLKRGTVNQSTDVIPT